jgi:hypothetical protein
MRAKTIAAQVLVVALLAAGLAAAPSAPAAAKDVDAYYVQTYRGEYLRFGKGGRAFVWIQQIWDMDQLHSMQAQPAPWWRACINLLWPDGTTSEGDCSGPRVRSLSNDPLLRSFEISFSMTAVNAGGAPWRRYPGFPSDAPG